MKILQVLRGPVGGVLRHVYDLSLYLSEQGHEVGLFADTRNVNDQSQVILDQLEKHLKLGIHRLSMPRTFGLDDFKALQTIRSFLTEHEIDVVHGHGAKGGVYARLATAMNKNKHLKAFYTPHGGTLHFSKSSPSGFVFLNIENFLTRYSDTIIFESAYSQSVFIKKVGEPKCNHTVIHNGLSESEFKPADLSSPDYDFLFVGELRMIKGVDILLKALVDIKNEKGEPATLYCVGAGPDAESFQQLAKDLGLNDRVTFPGAQPARETFHKAGTIIVASRNEALPYIVLEASSAQLPVIATDVGGIHEIFGPTSDDLVKPENIDALRQAMQATLMNYDQATAKAKQRFDFVREHFNDVKMASRIMDLYENDGDLSS